MRADAVMKRCSGAMVMAKRTGEGLREAAGANVRSWAALPQSRRSGYTCRERCAHVSPRRMGGARMGAVRSRISMTIIGAPQCRQTKVGRASTAAVKRRKVVRKVYQSRPFFGFRDAVQGRHQI